MKIALPLIVALATAAPVMAQDTIINPAQSITVDLGIGANYKPTYQGSDDQDTSAWFIFRNFSYSGRENAGRAFSLTPSLGYVGERDSGDDDRLKGMDKINRAYELGLKASWRAGATEGYVTARKGFGGHKGITGEFGTRYRIEASDQLTLWAGLEAGYGDDTYNETYFGVTATEARRSAYTAYQPSGGINMAGASLEARYELAPNTAVLGELKYSRIIGDAADSPLVMEENQPSVKLGIVRTLNFAF